MADASDLPSQPKRPYPWIAIGLAATAIVGVILVWQNRPTEPPLSNSNTKAPGPVIETPTEFTDIIGVVKSASPTEVTLEIAVTDASGASVVKPYRVMIDAETEQFELLIEKGGRRLEPRLPLELQAGDRVQAFAQENIAPLDKFTAVRIMRINN